MTESTQQDSAGSDERLGVMIIDDHPLVRQGLASLINKSSDLRVIGQAPDSQKALALMAEKEPDVAVVDLSLAGGSGLDLIKEIGRRHPSVTVLVLTMHDELFYAERALRAGARGYVKKGEETDEVLEAIRQVRRGEVYVSESLRSTLIQRAADPGPNAPSSAVESLSDRELEVFELVGRGEPTREIARMLSVSVKTVETHRHRIKEKLGLSTGTQMVRYAIRWVEREAGAPA
ncbi:MAG: response regulator transcription factor [Deltaproteobacteria bacterium]|nr:response regulator transcription factor [Deltaproteobacteria bacterium]